MTGKIYFIECGGRIKIGFSKNIDARLKCLSVASALPLKLVAAQAGTKRLEKAIHRHLAPHHAQGEWFFDCLHVRSVISEIVLLGGQAIGFQEPPPRTIERRKTSSAIDKHKHGQCAASLRQLAEPLHFGDRTKYAIDRAAKRAGLSYWRAFDIWYGKARRIEVHEVQGINAALVA